MYRAKQIFNSQNYLIECLPKGVQKKFLALCEPVELELADQLTTRGELPKHAYFPLTGYISLVIHIDTHPPLEVGMVGRESMLGSELALGIAQTPWRAVVQGAGSCWRIEAEALQHAMEDFPALGKVVQRALLARLHQQALATVCERFHPIEERLSRWLLMRQDRADAARIHVTQEFISRMLGVRRVSVSNAAYDLQKAGLIQYQRGKLKVMDRVGLEAKACSCYVDQQLLHSALRSANTSI